MAFLATTMCPRAAMVGCHIPPCTVWTRDSPSFSTVDIDVEIMTSGPFFNLNLGCWPKGLYPPPPPSLPPKERQMCLKSFLTHIKIHQIISKHINFDTIVVSCCRFDIFRISWMMLGQQAYVLEGGVRIHQFQLLCDHQGPACTPKGPFRRISMKGMSVSNVYGNIQSYR